MRHHSGTPHRAGYAANRAGEPSCRAGLPRPPAGSDHGQDYFKMSPKREQYEGRTLTVMLHGLRIGTLSREGVETLSFQYDEAYASDAANPPLSVRLPLRHEPYDHRETHSWFNALLAEGTRRQQLARIVNSASLQTWELLHAAGGECAGAVQTVGEEHRDEEPRVAVLVQHQLYTLLKDTPVEPIGTLSAAARISLAGAQEKVALYRTDDGQWALPLGGHPSSHILKPQSTRFERLVENEHYCMTLARRSGIDAARTSVQRLDDLAVLVVERYDRARARGGTLQRVHQEDFCAGARGDEQVRRGRRSHHAGTPHRTGGANATRCLSASCSTGSSVTATRTRRTTRYSSPARRARDSHLPTTSSPQSAMRGSTGRSRPAIGEAVNLNEVDRDQVEALGAQIGYARGEASQRLHALAERVRSAVAACRKEDPGPVRTDIIEARTDEARDWAKA